MKNKIHILAFILFLFEFAAASSAKAQGTIFVSNLESTNAGYVGVVDYYWMAQPFETGAASFGYNLDSVQMLIAVTGTPSGHDLAVSLYNDNGGGPGNSLSPLSGSDPILSGVCTYTASGVLLAPSTTYWILVTSGPVQSNDPVLWWGAAQSTNYESSDSWNLSAPLYSTDLTSWFAAPHNAFQFAVSATPTPEPSACVLLGLGLAKVLFRRRK